MSNNTTKEKVEVEIKDQQITINSTSRYDHQDSISDMTKEEEIIMGAGSIEDEKKLSEAIHSSIAESTNIDAIAKSPKQESFSLCRYLKNLNSLESNPKELSNVRKRLILITVALASAISPTSSTIYLPAILTMQEYFNCSATTINASLSIFTFFTAFFPLMWAPAGEQFGRRKLYLISFLIAVLGNVGCSQSVNVAMFIAFRGISAIGSSSVMSIGAGTLTDIYDAHERGKAFALYSPGPLIGPALGPIVGGYLNDAFGWRSNFYFITVLAFIIWLCILFFLPETYRPLPGLPGSKLLTNKEKFKKIDPFSGLKFFQYANITLCVVFTGINFMMYYIINTTFTRTYALQYHFDSGTVGLCYLPSAVGSIIGSNIAGYFADKVYNKRVAAANGNVYPEMRFNLGLIGFAVFIETCAFVAYGWCMHFDVHWAWGLVCTFFIAFALMIPIVTISTYMVDCFRRKSASVSAFSNLVRYTLAGVASLVSSDLENALGDGVLYSICAGIAIALFSFIIIVKMNYKNWKRGSDK